VHEAGECQIHAQATRNVIEGATRAVLRHRAMHVVNFGAALARTMSLRSGRVNLAASAGAIGRPACGDVTLVPEWWRQA